jgi:hypothetical protein
MKKIVCILIVAFLGSIALSSCTYSDYTCVCDYEVNGTPMQYKREYSDIQKKDAQEDCDILNIQYKHCELQ